MAGDPKWVFTCATGRSIENDPLNNAKQIPKCNSGAGSWIQINHWTEQEIQDLVVIEPNEIDPEQAAEAWGVGFTVVSIGLLIAAGFRAVVNLLRDL